MANSSNDPHGFTPEPELELDLRDYLRVLDRRKGTIIAAFVVVVGAAMAASFVRTPVYQAEAEMLLQARVSETIFDQSGSQQRDADRAVETEIQLIESEPVQTVVRQRLGQAPQITARQVGATDVITIQARHIDPDRAALIANTYVEAYIEFRRDQTVNDLVDAGEELQSKIDSLGREISTIDVQLETGAPPQSEPDGQGPGTPTPPTTVDAQTLQEQRAALVAQQNLFRQQLDQLQVGTALRSGGAQLVTPAVPPDSPAEPQPVRTGVLAAVVGLIFGVGLAFLFDYLDDSIRDDDDLERASGLPSLGVIPTVTNWKKEERPYLVSLAEPDSTITEDYRALRTSVQFLGLDRTMRTLQITSSVAREGKTTTLANLGVLFAKAGYRVALVDADLRRPRLHEFFGLSNRPGFTSVVLGNEALSTALQESTEVPRLSVLPSGPIPPLPSELLQSARAAEVISGLASEFDLVLVDSPPVLPVTDASILAAWNDAVLVVATAGVTSRRHVSRAVETLRQVEAPLLGTVLNRAPGHGAYGYGYGYRYVPRSDISDNGRWASRRALRKQRADAERAAGPRLTQD